MKGDQPQRRPTRMVRLRSACHISGLLLFVQAAAEDKRAVDTGRFGSALKGGFCFDSCCYKMTDTTKASALPPNAQTEQKQFCAKMFHDVRGDPCKFIDDSRGRYVAFRTEATDMCPCHKNCMLEDSTEDIVKAAGTRHSAKIEAPYLKVKAFVNNMGLYKNKEVALQTQTSQLEIRHLSDCIYQCVLEVSSVRSFGILVRDGTTHAERIRTSIEKQLTADTLKATCSNVHAKKITDKFHIWSVTNKKLVPEYLSVKETGKCILCCILLLLCIAFRNRVSVCNR